MGCSFLVSRFLKLATPHVSMNPTTPTITKPYRLLNCAVGTFDPAREYPGYYIISSCREGLSTDTARLKRRRSGSYLDLEPARYLKRPLNWHQLLVLTVATKRHRFRQSLRLSLCAASSKTKLEGVLNRN